MEDKESLLSCVVVENFRFDTLDTTLETSAILLLTNRMYDLSAGAETTTEFKTNFALQFARVTVYMYPQA